MEPTDSILQRIKEKVRAIGPTCRIHVCEKKGIVHIGIIQQNMGKAHRNVRDTIRRRIKRSRRLSRYTVLVYINPREPGRAVNTFVLRPESDIWDPRPVKMLPAEELVA